jgi:hypothetical protein
LDDCLKVSVNGTGEDYQVLSRLKTCRGRDFSQWH